MPFSRSSRRDSNLVARTFNAYTFRNNTVETHGHLLFLFHNFLFMLGSIFIPPPYISEDRETWETYSRGSDEEEFVLSCSASCSGKREMQRNRETDRDRNRQSKARPLRRVIC